MREAELMQRLGFSPQTMRETRATMAEGVDYQKTPRGFVWTEVGLAQIEKAFGQIPAQVPPVEEKTAAEWKVGGEGTAELNGEYLRRRWPPGKLSGVMDGKRVIVKVRMADDHLFAPRMLVPVICEGPGVVRCTARPRMRGRL